jgi:hypothetical protein
MISDSILNAMITLSHWEALKKVTYNFFTLEIKVETRDFNSA